MPREVRLIGVHALPVTEDLVNAQAKELYGAVPSAAELEQARRQLASVVLIEVLVSDADAEFEVRDFTQADPDLPRDNWQAAWAEALLSADGEHLLGKRSSPLPPGQSTFRIAFYLHNWHPRRPLETSYGRVPGPQPSAMPERLQRLVPYELLD